MKKLIKHGIILFGIIAFAAVMVCSFTACKDEPDDNPYSKFVKIPDTYSKRWMHRNANGSIDCYLKCDMGVCVGKSDGYNGYHVYNDYFSSYKTEVVSGNTVFYLSNGSSKKDKKYSGIIMFKDSNLFGLVLIDGVSRCFPEGISLSGGWEDDTSPVY